MKIYLCQDRFALITAVKKFQILLEEEKNTYILKNINLHTLKYFSFFF